MGRARAERCRRLPRPVPALELVGGADGAREDPRRACVRRSPIPWRTAARSRSRRLRGGLVPGYASSTPLPAPAAPPGRAVAPGATRPSAGARPYDEDMELSARKREILRRVVEEHVATGQPVGSKALVERPGGSMCRPPRSGASSSSSSRSACSRTRTRPRAGFRPRAATGSTPRSSSAVSKDARLRSRSTSPRCGTRSRRRSVGRPRRSPRRRTCLRSSPRLRSRPRRCRHIEVLQLQSRVVIVVVITASGAVSKRVFELEDGVDADSSTGCARISPRRSSASAPA